MATKMGGNAEQGKPRTQSSQRVQHDDGTVEYLSGTDGDVDATSADSFPASDPPSFTSVTRTGKPKKRPQQSGQR